MNIIELANESGLVYYGMGKDRARFIHHLENFAHLAASAARADEREKCIELCDDYDVKYDVNPCDTAKSIGLEIRARGTT